MLFKKKENKEEKQEEVEKKSFIDKARERHERFQLIVAFIGAIYFAVNIYLTASKYKESFASIYPFIVGIAIAYILVFVIFLIVHRNDSKQIKNDTKKFKNTLKIVKLIMNVLFIGASLLIFIGSLNAINDAGAFAVIETIFSGLLLVIKLFSAIKKVIKTIKKRVKSDKKEKQKALKAKEKEEKKK